ncbi:MAG: PQQ-binding-like beta-propeller repeat protein [Planctomycetia bacterium]|nr:PQQ-binding-like beta-propeller repeat protein [Planctomycetia bacterium]
MKRAVLAWTVLAAAAWGQAVSPRWVEETPELAAARRAAESGRATEAAAKILKVMDDPETVDVFVGDPGTRGVVRGLRATARRLAGELAAESPAFRDAWEAEAALRLASVRAGDRERAGLERVASVFRGTDAARRALRRLSALAWEEGRPGRTADLLEQCGLDLTPREAARLAAGRRATGRGPSAGEWLRRWESSRAAGLRPSLPTGGFPPLDSPLLVRGVPTTLQAFLDTLRPSTPPPWRGELDSSRPPFPPLRPLAGPPQRVVLFDQLPANAAPPGGDGVVFRDLTAWNGGSPVRLLAAGKRLVASSRHGLSVLDRAPDGRWRVAAGPRGAPPLASHGLATDGRRAFTLVPDPDGRAGTVRLVPAAFDVSSGTPVRLWVGATADEEGPFDRAWASGPPALHEGRLYVPSALVDSAFVPSLVCLDAATGARLWATPLGEASRQLFSTTTRTASSPPTVRDGLVLLSTGQGLVAALDAATGDPEWLFAYPGSEDAGTFADAPPCLAGARALFTPLDARSELLLDLHAARALVPPWPAALPPFRFALPDGPRIVLCGSDGALAGEGGARGVVKVLNSRPSGDVLFELPDPPAGRPAAWEGMLFVPTQQELLAMDLASGALTVLRTWGEAEAGDIVRLPGWLAVVREGEIRMWEAQDR